MKYSSLENAIRSVVRGKEPVQEQVITPIEEGHYKVGDDVIYKGQEAEVIKVDPSGVGKYYTIQMDDGATTQASDDELMPEDEVGDDDDDEEDEKMDEKAVSQAQQKAAGIALAAKRGEIPKSQLQPSSKAMMGMSTKELEKFAKTKHAGLPTRKEEVELDEQVPPQDAGEYDYEGDMAKTQLNKAMDAAAELKSMLSDNENLPEWIQKKISMGSYYLDTARDYMKNRNNVPGMAEGRRPKPKDENEPEKQTKNKEYLVKFEKGGSAKVRSYTGTSELDVRSKAKVDAQRMGMSVASVRLREEVELEEATLTKQQVKQAIGIARDKRYAKGNVTGAVKAMDKVNPGLAQHPAVKKELQRQNETKSAPKGFHFTRDGKLKRGDADQDGPGGPMLRSDPLDKRRSKIPPVSEMLDNVMVRAMKRKS